MAHAPHSLATSSATSSATSPDAALAAPITPTLIPKPHLAPRPTCHPTPTHPSPRPSPLTPHQVRDLEIISKELRLKDVAAVEKIIDPLAKEVARDGKAKHL